jgi:hypothetical protein
MSQQQFIPTPKFEEYKERFKDFYKMQRRVDGVILVEAHTNGGPIQLSVENHRSVGQMPKTVGADPENTRRSTPRRPWNMAWSTKFILAKNL